MDLPQAPPGDSTPAPPAPAKPELPEPPPPPEVKTKEEETTGWPKWIIEEFEATASATVMEERPTKVMDEKVSGLVFHEDSERDSFDDPDTTDPFGRCTSELYARAPLTCAFCLTGLFVLPVLVGLLGVPFLRIDRLPIKVETTFDSFLQTDVPASVALNAFDLARDDRPISRRLQGQPYSAVKDLVLIYELKGNSLVSGGLLANHYMGRIARYEQKLRALPSWQALCSTVEVGAESLCNPGISLASYARASWLRNSEDDLEPQSFRFDGEGQDYLNLPTTLLMAEQHQLTKIALPKDSVNAMADGGEKLGELRQLRSVFRFKIYCCDQDDSSTALRRDFNERIDADWGSFVSADLIKVIKEGLGNDIGLYYDGTGIQQLEVHEALFRDMWLAVGSVVFVHVYLLYHTRSILLSLVGPLLAALALPVSFVVCAVVFKATTVSFASALALFLTVGFGADVIFVYTDFWRVSSQHRRSDANRIAWTFWQAGSASFATTATTALSFFANLASAIRALRQFAFLMGLCVVFAWMLISLIYTPLCLVNERMNKRLCKGSVLKSAQKVSMTTRVLSGTLKSLYKGRYAMLLLGVAACALFVGLSVPRLELGASLPQIFPKDHNRHLIEGMSDKFEPLSDVFGSSFQAPRIEEQVCGKEVPSDAHACSLHWCVAQLYEPPLENVGVVRPNSSFTGNVSNCSCWRQQSKTCETVGLVRGITRLIGVDGLTFSQESQVTVDRLLSDGSLSVESDPVTSTSSRLSPLVMQDWLSGKVEVRPLTQATGYYQRPEGASDSGGCSWEDLCFCGVEKYVCEIDDDTWQPLPVFQLMMPPGTSSETNRRLGLIEGTVPPDLRAKVWVCFGLWITEDSPLLGDRGVSETWGYMNTFIPQDPWTQRIMAQFCDELPDALRVTQSWCWIQDFRTWLQTRSSTRGLRFPTWAQDFDSLALEFDDWSPSSQGRQYIWVEQNSLKALYFSFEIDMATDASSFDALELKGQWNTYVLYFENVAKMDGRGELGIYHISRLWAQAEAESELLMSTAVTIAIVLILAFLGMLLFTQSLILSMYVVMATAEVMIGLVFFIVVLMGWQVGLIEVISIIYFVGYAVTYSLHVAHKYADSEALKETRPQFLKGELAVVRFQRTKWALTCIGGAAMGSAVTTAGSSLFLVFCTLSIFGKLGSMCLAVTVLSILTALGPLPAALLIMGPPKPGCNMPSLCRHRDRGSLLLTRAREVMNIDD